MTKSTPDLDPTDLPTPQPVLPLGDEVPANSPRGLLTTALRGLLNTALGFNTSEALAAIATLRERLDQQEREIVFDLRLHGATWQEIADATGMNSRQVAQHRYEKSAGFLDRLNEAMDRAPLD